MNSQNSFAHLERDGAVATIRLDRPPVNALNFALQGEIRAISEEIAADDSIRAVVIYGGPKHFAAGADIKEMAGMSFEEMSAASVRLHAAFNAVAAIPQPVIAAITGYALGGGCELALCADIRIAGDNAKLGQPEVLLGIIPGAGGTQRLTRVVGPSRAKDLVFTGRHVTADEALSLGLINQIVAPDDVYAAAKDLADRLAAGAPLALRAAKRAIDGGVDIELASALEIERVEFAGLFATQDQKTGMQTFIESGPGKAVFEGK